MWKIEDAVELNFETGELTWKIRVNPSVQIGQVLGTKHGRGYKFFRLNKQFYFCHKVVWFLAYGKWPEGEVDHINGVKDDNRPENLRDVTHRQNMQNKKSQTNSTSIYKGVHWHRASKKWRSVIWDGHRKIHVGLFEGEKEAALAYDGVAREVFGSYARLNF
jgi:hypothetical protein